MHTFYQYLNKYKFFSKLILAFTDKPGFLKPIDGPKPEFNKELNEKVSLYQGDITKLAIDVIVNAANSKLAGGGGGKIYLNYFYMNL